MAFGFNPRNKFLGFLNKRTVEIFAHNPVVKAYNLPNNFDFFSFFFCTSENYNKTYLTIT